MTPQELLQAHRDKHGVAEPRLGCSLVAHRDLGFCEWCPDLTVTHEMTAWRLLAMAERGIPSQPSEIQ